MFREAIARSIRLAAVLVFFLLAPSALTFGGAAETEKPSPDVQEFLKLLGKSDVQEWLRGQQTAAAGPDDPQAQKIKASVGRALSERLTAIRTHLANLLLVIPGLGNEIRQATQRLHDASGGSGFLSIFVGAFLLVGLGFAAQAYVRNRLPPGHQPATENEEPSPASTQFQGLAVSLVRELTRALAFCVACFAPLLLLERDQLSESVLLNFLLAGAAWMLARAVASVIDALAANDPSPDDHAEKRHFCFWMVAAVGWFALGSAIAETARITGMDPLATDLVSYVLGLGLLVIGLTAIWRAPRKQVSSPERLVRYSAWRWLATLFLIVLWIINNFNFI